MFVLKKPDNFSFPPIKGQVYPRCVAQHPPEIAQLDADPKLRVICPRNDVWAGTIGTVSGFVVVFEQRWHSHAQLCQAVATCSPRVFDLQCLASPGTPALPGPPRCGGLKWNKIQEAAALGHQVQLRSCLWASQTLLINQPSLG